MNLETPDYFTHIVEGLRAEDNDVDIACMNAVNYALLRQWRGELDVVTSTHTLQMGKLARVKSVGVDIYVNQHVPEDSILFYSSPDCGEVTSNHLVNEHDSVARLCLETETIDFDPDRPANTPESMRRTQLRSVVETASDWDANYLQVNARTYNQIIRDHRQVLVQTHSTVHPEAQHFGTLFGQMKLVVSCLPPDDTGWFFHTGSAVTNETPASKGTYVCSVDFSSGSLIEPDIPPVLPCEEKHEDETFNPCCADHGCLPTEKCSTCGGEGKVNLTFKIEDPCEDCEGKGYTLTHWNSHKI